jgi:hypothetical protein
MNIKLLKNDKSLKVDLEGLHGNPSDYYNKTQDWLTRRDFLGQKTKSKKIIDSEYPIMLRFVFQNPIEGDWYETGRASITFLQRNETTNISIDIEATGPRFLSKMSWGEYLNILRTIEEYLGIICVKVDEKVRHTLYPQEMISEVAPQLKINLTQDALLALFLVLFFVVFQIINYGTILSSLMGLFLVFVFSYRDFRLYRQLSERRKNS